MKTTFPFAPLRAITITAALGAALMLGACGDELDEDRSLLQRAQVAQGGPDPFLIVEHGALEIPANLGVLPPPRPGAVSRVEPRPDLLVAAALGGSARGFAATPGTAERLLLSSMGASDVPADIRTQIEAEHLATLEDADTGLFTSLISALGNPYRNQQLDPVAEVVRLRQAYPNVTTPNAPLSAPQ